jgi:hypothetical protein
MALFCRGNNDITTEVTKQIEHSIHQGIEINADATAHDRDGKVRDVFGSSRKGLMMMNLIFLPSWVLKFLL